jgi:DNA polymerase-1
MQADFSQAELRVLTWLARDEGMRDLFNDPTQDVFYQLCVDMIPGFENMDPVLQKEFRTLIKTFAYGVSYGRTAEGVASDSAFNMTVAQAQVYMDKFNAMIPAIKEYQRGIIHTIHEGKDLINPFGRHRRFYLITDLNRKDVENEALAYMPQSTASDICLEAACRLNEEGLWIVNLVHDSIMVETLPNEADDIGKRMDEVMCGVADEVTGGYVRFATEHTVGRSWYDLK